MYNFDAMRDQQDMRLQQGGYDPRFDDWDEEEEEEDYE